MRFVRLPRQTPSHAANRDCTGVLGRPPPGLPRWVNYVAAALGISLLAPLLGLVWLLVRLDSTGPALFRQRRVGRGGREFVCYKFRTMKVGSGDADFEISDLASYTFSPASRPSDPRHTKLGTALRSTSFDELPQLLNVMLGDMALVGPRPELPQIVRRYPAEYGARHTILPGITGLAQVSGRSDLSYGETIRQDLKYTRCRTAGCDLVILWRTLGAVFSSRGAR